MTTETNSFHTDLDQFFKLNDNEVCLKDFYLSKLIETYNPFFKNAEFQELKNTPAVEVFKKYPPLKMPRNIDYNYEKLTSDKAIEISKNIIKTLSLDESLCLDPFVFAITRMPTFREEHIPYWHGQFQLFTGVLISLQKNKHPEIRESVALLYILFQGAEKTPIISEFKQKYMNDLPKKAS